MLGPRSRRTCWAPSRNDADPVLVAELDGLQPSCLTADAAMQPSAGHAGRRAITGDTLRVSVARRSRPRRTRAYRVHRRVAAVALDLRGVRGDCEDVVARVSEPDRSGWPAVWGRVTCRHGCPALGRRNSPAASPRLPCWWRSSCLVACRFSAQSVGSDVGGRRVWLLLHTRAALSCGGSGSRLRPAHVALASMSGGRTLS